MIRVFIPTGVYPPDSGGPAAYVPMLEKHLPQHGFELDVLPFRTVRHLPKGIAHFVYFWRALSRARYADIVYAQDAVSVGVPALFASLLARKPFIVKIVGDHVWEQGKLRFGVRYELDDFPFWPTQFYLFWMRVFQQLVVRAARVIIVPSDYLKHVVMKWGIPKEHIIVVYNGVEMPVPVHEPAQAIERPLIVSAGRLVPWKGFQGVIDTIKDKPWHLAIVGDGPMRARLKAHAHEAGVEDRVLFTGELSRPEVHGWIKTADVFVLNSSYEGMSHLLIEVMSLGTPVIASDIPGNREVMHHAKEGFLVPPGHTGALHNSLSQIFADPEGAKQRAAAAQSGVKIFSAEETVKELARVLKEICG